MNYIIYDLECTCWQVENGKQSEIIEIGAVRFNGFGEETGSYNKFVKPVLHPRLSRFCTDLTSIEQRFVDRAKTYEVVIEEFQDWIGLFDDDDYLLCSWGGFDKKMLIQDCELHELESDWAKHHINLKQQFHEIKGWRRSVGLRRAVEIEGFDFDGIHHRAIADAENLAKIFTKYIDRWRY